MNFIMSYSKDDTSPTVSSFRGVISFEMTKNKTLGEMVTQGKFHIKFILGEREKERERERQTSIFTPFTFFANSCYLRIQVFFNILWLLYLFLLLKILTQNFIFYNIFGTSNIFLENK